MDNPLPAPLAVYRDDVLAGHVALITGGATGIGRGIASAFASLGADVAIVSRRPEVIATAARELSDASGRTVLGLVADVRDADAIAAAVNSAHAHFGKLDTLVNNAAGNFLAPAAALSPNGFRTVIDIDLGGTFNASRAAFAMLRANQDGLIINISATLHYHGTPMQLHASAAKAGIDALTRNLAVEWGPSGVRVCAIAPGPIGDTEGMRRLAPGDIKAKHLKTIPLGRFGLVDEIAAAAVYLRSAAARYVTGNVLVVDGGQSLTPAGWDFSSGIA